jgi:hypothetical protein
MWMIRSNYYTSWKTAMYHWKAVSRSGRRYDAENEAAKGKKLCESDRNWLAICIKLTVLPKTAS